MKKVVVLTLIVALIVGIFPISTFAETEDNTEIFFDDFSSDKLDTSKWLVANKAWGGNNGGVVPENVSISDGILKLEGHGDLYEGTVEGYNKTDGKRTGAAIATREYFGSGSYEIVAKVAPELGACSAIWTFEYEEYYPGDAKYEELAPENAPYYAVNHEIDIEMPGRPSNNSKPSYEYALCNTWRGERGDEYTTGYTKLPKAQNDGEFHKYRFDWHTGDEGETPRVDFYFDDELITTNTTHIPTNEGRLWIGLWFPNGWAGTPDFDTAIFEIDSVKITPFHEAGDTEQNETYSEDGWAEDTIFDDPVIVEPNTKTVSEAINEMKVGWNLGNTLDSCNYKKEYLEKDRGVSHYETLWGNPVTTKEMIDEVKAAGFGSVRVPVTYYDHILDDGTIDELWFQRVEEVVNYVLDNDMYCILDVHHDSGLCDQGSWIRTDADKYEENAEKLRGLWLQIANRFKNYDYKLIFEGFNEIVDTNKNYDWNSGYNNTINVNKLNQVFVDTVRETGGKNADRFLAVSTFGAITDEQKLSTFVMPKDTAEDKIILALHDYVYKTADIDVMLGRIKKYCIDKNIPVILDEFGTRIEFNEDERAKFAEEYVSKAKELGIACFVWDDGGHYKILDRTGKKWAYEKVKDALINPFLNDKPVIEPDPTAEPLNFTFDLNYVEEIATPGATISVIGKISEIQKNSANGLIALGGVLEYDKNVLELQDIKGLNDWKMSLQDYNEENGKWVAVSNSYVETASDVFELTFKVKDNLENIETEVKLTNIEGGTAQDKNGVVYSDDTKATISIEKEETYILGDVDGDGDITINDLAQMKLHIVEIINLEGVHFKAGDLDKDGDIDINDLAKMKLYLIGLITEF